MNMVFELEIGKTLEIYVDDMVIKTPEVKDHVENLEETFRSVRSLT